MPDTPDPAALPPPTPEMLALLRRWLLRGYQPGTQIETTPAEQAEAARVAAAQRMREGVRPSFGRYEGAISKVISKYPGHVLEGIWEDLTNPPDPRIDPDAAAGFGFRLALGTLGSGARFLPRGGVQPTVPGIGAAPWSDEVIVHAAREKIPGAGTGHLEGLVDDALPAREAYSKGATPADPAGGDILYNAQGVKSEPSLPGIGSFTSASGRPETNPTLVARARGKLVGHPDNPRLSPETVENVTAAEALDGYVNVQNMAAAHAIVPTVNAAEQTSVRIPLAASTSPEQVAALNDLALRRGFFVVDTGNGVTLIGSEAGPNAATLTGMLQGDWGRRLGEVLGVERRNLQQVKVEPLSIDYEKEFAAKNAGRGMATRKLLESTTQRAQDAFDASPKIKDYIKRRFAEDAAYAETANRPLRQDVQLARWILARYGFKGLRKALDDGLFLPGIIGVLGLRRMSDGSLEVDGG